MRSRFRRCGRGLRLGGFPLLEANASLVWAANKANGSREGCSLFRLVLVASLAGRFVVLGRLFFELVRELRGGVDIGPAVASRTARPIACDAGPEVSGILPTAPPNQKSIVVLASPC